MATTCTYHCGACGRHFHSLSAFDIHRDGRRCADPLDLEDRDGKPRLVALARDGRCDHSWTQRVRAAGGDESLPHSIDGCTIWTDAKNVGRERPPHWRASTSQSASP
jgi:hypothetical protein